LEMTRPHDTQSLSQKELDRLRKDYPLKTPKGKPGSTDAFLVHMLINDIENLRNALKFYAEPDNYEPALTSEDKPWHYPVLEDAGEIARKELVSA
jgi:hypothetical protein